MCLNDVSQGKENGVDDDLQVHLHNKNCLSVLVAHCRDGCFAPTLDTLKNVGNSFNEDEATPGVN